MKCIIVVLFFVAIANGGGLVRNKVEEDLLAFFNKWLKGGILNFTLPLPAVDVISIPGMEGTYKEFGTKLSYSTSEMKLTGVPKSYIDELVVTETDTALTARGTLVAPSLKLTAGKYNLDGRAFIFYPLKGEGEMRVIFRNAVLLFDIELGTNGKSMWVEKLQFGVDVDKIKIDLTDTSSTIVNNLNSKAAGLFADHREEAQDALRDSTLPFINSFLSDKAPAQLLQAIASA